MFWSKLNRIYGGHVNSVELSTRFYEKLTKGLTVRPVNFFSFHVIQDLSLDQILSEFEIDFN